jgi:hypothetical protein
MREAREIRDVNLDALEGFSFPHVDYVIDVKAAKARARAVMQGKARKVVTE